MIDPIKVSLFGVPYKFAKGRQATFVWCMASAMRAEAAGLTENCAPNTAAVILLWACMLYTNPRFTIEEAADLIDAEIYHGRTEELGNALREAKDKASGPKREPEPQSPSLEAAQEQQDLPVA